jgi:hypothetical protein
LPEQALVLQEGDAIKQVYEMLDRNYTEGVLEDFIGSNEKQ